MIWFHTLYAMVILLFTIALIGEKDLERQKIYQPILALALFCFVLLNFLEWVGGL